MPASSRVTTMGHSAATMTPDAAVDGMGGLNSFLTTTSAAATAAPDAAMASGANVQLRAMSRRARIKENERARRNVSKQAKKQAEKQAQKEAEAERIEAEKLAEEERLIKEQLEHEMLKQMCIRLNSYFDKDRRSIEQFLQAIPSTKRRNGPKTLGRFDWIDAPGDVRNQVFHLLGTRGWELERIGKHAKYSRTVELTVDDRVMKKTQVVFISVSPSDWRAPDKVVKDLHEAEREVVRVFL